MPSAQRTLTLDQARAHISRSALEPSNRDTVGLEVEWLLYPADGPGRYVDHSAVARALHAAKLPGGSLVTFEPGGQLELSSVATDGVGTACTAVARDAGSARVALHEIGVEMVGIGLDPLRPERRVLALPRYEAMEAFFDMDGPAGRWMMCRTAAVQVNIDLGLTPAARWHLAHILGPTLAACFANSPYYCGAPSGWRSARLSTWWSIDPTRTGPVPADVEPTAAWARYALNAHVMLIRATEDRFIPMVRRMTLEDWIEHGHPFGWPTIEDLDYHCTTLFPPLRPRGWLEIRMIDAQEGEFWRVPAAVCAALLYVEEAGKRAADEASSTARLWREAGRDGLSHPGLAASAIACFRLALDALGEVGADAVTADAVQEFFDRYVARGRSPADDHLDAPTPYDMPTLEATWS